MKVVVKPYWIWVTAVCLLTVPGYSDPGFTSSVKSGPYPWTHTRFLESGRNFHFAVVADRNGGCRPGVFDSAVEKLNLLRPDLVMSVGDFIEGYTKDPDALTAQWAKVDGIVKELEPPFFYVLGNHDYGEFGENKAARDTRAKFWQQLRGPTYYWFTYQDTLFLCLNSLGGPDHRWGLGDAQLAWAKDVLAKHSNVRWTFVFLHCPLWVPDAAPKPTQFPELEAILAARNHTIFAGHWHQYARYDRHGMRYFVLSVTGGGSELSGPQNGEFDHIMWVSMTDTGPRFANLALDGVLYDDVSTEASMYLKDALQFVPVSTAGGKPGADFSFAFKNRFGTPLKFSMAWKDDPAWSIEPRTKNGTVAPGAACQSVFHAVYKGKTWPVVPTLTCRFETGTRFKVSWDYKVPAGCLGSMWPKGIVTASRVNQPPVIDGRLDDAAWQGPPAVDGYLYPNASATAMPKTQTWVAYDEKNLYVAWRCTESDMGSIIAAATQRDGDVWPDDHLECFIDTRLDHRSYFQFAVTPRGTFWDGSTAANDAFNSHAKAAAVRGRDGWTAELAIPWQDMNVAAPKAGTRMGFELSRARPRNQSSWVDLSQFPPLGNFLNHQPKLFGELVFGQ